MKILGYLGLAKKDDDDGPAVNALPLLLAPILAIIASRALGVGWVGSIFLVVAIALASGAVYAVWLIQRSASSG